MSAQRLARTVALAVIIGMVHYVLPYAVFPIFNAMSAIDHNLERAARSLGAKTSSVLWLVIFPLSRYCIAQPARDALVLGFGGLSPRRIAAGAEKLAAIVRRARKRSGR